MNAAVNHYEREGRLFVLLIEAIEEENPNPDEGVESLLSVLRFHADNLRRQATGRFPTFNEYREALKATYDASELIDALAENHPDDAKDEDSQSRRMMALLIDVRHDLQKTSWDVEDMMPEFAVGFRRVLQSLQSPTIH